MPPSFYYIKENGSQEMQFKRISSKRLTELLTAKKGGSITTAENEELGYYADNFANIILRTPKMRRFLYLYDKKGFYDIENEMRAQIAITIVGTCPYSYENGFAKSYSYCLYCANSAACGVIRRHIRRLKIDGAIRNISSLWIADLFPYLHKVRNLNRSATSEKTNL